MTDETLLTWNQKMTEASKAIRVTSQELTKLQKKTLESYIPEAI